jgi:hypothetical protein
MTWFADHVPIVNGSERLEECLGHPRVEGERWRQLHEDWPELLAESTHLFEEHVKIHACSP